MSAYADLIPGTSPSRRRSAYDDLLPGGAPAVAGEPAEDAEPGVTTATGSRVVDAVRRINEEIITSQPARMTMTRRGGAQVQPADLSLAEPPAVTADWTGEGGVLPSIVPAAGAQIRSALSNLRRMGNEESIRQREMVIDSTPLPGPEGAPQLPHLVRRAIERQRALVEAEKAQRPEIQADAVSATDDLAAVTPKDMSTAQKAVFSAGTSAPTTLAGLALGVATKSPALAMAVAGGGGSTIQAGSTYGEALEKLTAQGVEEGEAHRRASLAATGDALIEGLDALPVGMALKSGSAFAKRLAKTIATESVTEGVQGLAQDFRAMAMEDPDKTLGEVWENFKVSVLAGAIGGSVYGTVGGAANAGQKKPAAMHFEGDGSVQPPADVSTAVESPAPAAAPTAPKPDSAPAKATAYDDLVPGKQGELVLGSPDDATQQPAVKVPETEIDKAPDVQQMRAAARTYAKENLHGKNVTNEATGFDIGIRRSGIAHALNNANSDDLAMIPVIPQLLETGRYIGQEADRKGRRDIKAYHFFESVADRAGTLMKVRLVVRENQYGKFFYDHVVTEKTTPDGISRAEGPKPQVRIEPTSGADESVGDLPEDGNLGMPAHVVPAGSITAAAGGATPPARAGGKVAVEQARPDAIRAAMQELFGAPISEKHQGKKNLGIYRIKPETIRLRNRNDLRTAAHEVGHHISNRSRPFRAVMKQHAAELIAIMPRAYKMQIAAGKKMTKALQIEEGFAEFIAEYLTNPQALQAKVPGFYKAFETWLEQNPTYAASLAKVQAMVGAHQALSPEQKILAKVGVFKEPLGQRVQQALSKDTWNAFVGSTLDNTDAYRRMVADLAPGLAESKNPHIAARLLAGDGIVIEDWINNWTSPYDYAKRQDTKNYGKPLKEILKPVLEGGEVEANKFKAYLIARRAAELKKVGKENLLDLDEIRAGLALETPQFKQVAAEVYAYNDRLLDYAVEGGLLSQEVADKFREYDAYIPFFREPEGDAKGGGRGGDPFKRLTGGTANLRDPIANLIQNTANIIHATNRNAVIQKTAALANDIPGGGRWVESVKVPQEAHQLATQRIIDELRKQGVKIDTAMAQNLAAMQTFFTQSGKGDERTRTIVYKEGGELKAIQVNDPLLWKSMSSLPPPELDLITEILALPARTLRAGVVLDPGFMLVANPIRDTLSSMIQSKGRFIPGASTANGVKLRLQQADAFKLQRAFGGGSSSQFADSDHQARIIERMAKRGNFDKLSIVSPMRLLEALEKVGDYTESASRIAEFDLTYKKGDFDSALRAALNSREVATDFGMRGSNTSLFVLTRLVPFMRPAMQGMYKTARVLSGADGKGAAGKAAVLGTSMALASMLLALSNSDEDWYKRLEEWEKATYWHFKLGGEIWRIPKPFEYGLLFASMPEAIALLTAEKEGGEEFKKRMIQILSQVMIRVVPQAVVALAEPWANKSFFTGRKIVPDRQEKLEPGMQANPNTSKVAQSVGEAANVSPAVIDNMVRNVFGTLGVHAMTAADQLLEQTGAFPPSRERGWQSWPAIRRIVHDPDNPNSKQQRDFYDQLEKYRRAVATVKELKARGEDEKADTYKAAHQEDYDSAKKAEETAKKLASIRRRIRAIEWNRDMTPADKRSAINAENEEAQAEVEEHTPLYRAAKKSYSRPAIEGAN